MSKELFINRKYKFLDQVIQTLKPNKIEERDSFYFGNYHEYIFDFGTIELYKNKVKNYNALENTYEETYINEEKHLFKCIITIRCQEQSDKIAKIIENKIQNEKTYSS